MIQGVSPIFQALLGTLFTWGLTAAGSALVFVFSSGQRKILDGSLGFAAGVMTAASYWSLLAPAIEMASNSGFYGDEGQWAFVPASIGFLLGAAFVYSADVFLPMLGVKDPAMALAIEAETKPQKEDRNDNYSLDGGGPVQVVGAKVKSESSATLRRKGPHPEEIQSLPQDLVAPVSPSKDSQINWKRILLLIIAITVHNIPEGLAVGVGFGAVGKTASATFENARNLAIGIGIQNFPEGLAVSLPLRGSGMNVWKSFWYGQLSGAVEPVAGILGAVAVVVAEPVLPYALAFAAGAMIYVVVDDIIPEAQMCGNGKLASWGTVVGFVVMMSLDVGLG